MHTLSCIRTHNKQQKSVHGAIGKTNGNSNDGNTNTNNTHSRHQWSKVMSGTTYRFKEK